MFTFIPRSAVAGPNSLFNELLSMGIEEISHILFRRYRSNEFVLHLLDELDSIFRDVMQRAHDRTVFDGKCWADERNEVRHVRNSDAQV
jgi:hypothetical protein